MLIPPHSTFYPSLPRESTISRSSSVSVALSSIFPKLDCQLATIRGRQSSRRCTENENGRQKILPAVLVHFYRYGMNLPVSAAVGSATTVETTTCCSSTNRAAAESAVHSTVRDWAATESTIHYSASGESRPSAEAGPSVEAAASVEAAVEPRACADEDSAVEPVRTVVAVRRTRVRVIRVVAVSARRSCADVSRTDSDCHRADSDANRYSLRAGSRYER
jgi:hypothetical protein